MKRQADKVMQSDQPTHSPRRVFWEGLKQISLYLFSAKARYAFLYDPLAEANGNDPYNWALMIFIHCRPIYGTDTEANGNDPYKWALMIFIHYRPIYGTDTEAKNGALAKTPAFILRLQPARISRRGPWANYTEADNDGQYPQKKEI